MTPNETAMLALIGFSEGATYGTIVSGPAGPETFTDFTCHPFARRSPKLVRPGLYSTAAGRYQINWPTWQEWAPQLGLHNFEPASQDGLALTLIRHHGGLEPLLKGDIVGAMKACAGVWASLPDSPYGQPTHSVSVMLAKWNELRTAPQTITA